MASWIAVITNVGARLMANWTNGTVLNIDNAVAGTGVYPEVALLAQTSLVEEKQKISIVSSKVENDARKIKIQIQAAEEGYVLNQIGLIASLDSGEQLLLALFQNERGIAIPSVAESPDFCYTFYCFLTVSNQGDFSLSVDPSAFVAYGTMQDFVSEEIKRQKDGLIADIHALIDAKLAQLSSLVGQNLKGKTVKFTLADVSNASDDDDKQLFYIDENNKIEVSKIDDNYYYYDGVYFGGESMGDNDMRSGSITYTFPDDADAIVTKHNTEFVTAEIEVYSVKTYNGEAEVTNNG